MRLISDVDSDKLRGGFYTPDFVVDHCMQLVERLLASRGGSISVLEPSAGDGAFVRGLNRRPSLAGRVGVTCVELLESESAKCGEVLRQGPYESVCNINGSFFEWAEASTSRFTAVVGNPPFLRYQFVDARERKRAEELVAASFGVLQGVSNLYIPFVLLALERLMPAGVFCMVLPSELVGTVSGGQVREALRSHLDDLRIDLFPKDAFPTILQDVVVVSGVRRSSSRRETETCPVTFAEHHAASEDDWRHLVAAHETKWTKFLLQPVELSEVEAAMSLPSMRRLGELASFTVSIVTGANDYFTVSSDVVQRYALDTWSKPLLARTVDSPGLVFGTSDHEAAAQAERKAWLLHFAEDAAMPSDAAGPSTYLQMGVDQALPARYKCRIRSPWYRVPHVWAGSLMMSKRANLHHRVILNEANVLTTDTIYRGRMLPSAEGRERDFVACFHNSLTLLTSELEGRTYGGGVLELVPSEISRLTVPMLETNGDLRLLDEASRRLGGQRDTSERIVTMTDETLMKKVPGYADVLATVDGARRRLQARRHAAQASSPNGV